MNDDLLQQLVEEMRNMEMNYRPGAWEKFRQRKQERKNIVRWPHRLARIAAVLLLAGLLTVAPKKLWDNNIVLYQANTSSGQNRTGTFVRQQDAISALTESSSPSGSRNTTAQQSPEEQATHSTAAVGENISTVSPMPATISNRGANRGTADRMHPHHTKGTPGLSADAAGRAYAGIPTYQDAPLVLAGSGLSLNRHRAAARLPADSSQATLTVVTPRLLPASPMPHPAADQKDLAGQQEHTDSLLAIRDKQPGQKPPNKRTANGEIPRWNFDLALGQALDASAKTNTNFGVAALYTLGNRLGVSGGIYYNEFGAERSYNNDNSLVSVGSVLVQTTAAIRGIELPLELRYKIRPHMHIRTGASIYGILNQQQSLTYNDYRQVSSSYVDVNGQVQTISVIVSEPFTVAASAADLNRNKTMGVYNLSVEFEQNLFKTKTLILEPYLKMPMTTYSQQQLRLNQAGLRLRLAF